MQSRRLVYFILTAFITGNLLILYIQYNSSKNINALIKGGENYLAEYTINSNLKAIERNVVTIESNVSDFISTGDAEYLQGLDKRIAEVKKDLLAMQGISDDESSVKEIDELQAMVENKIGFSKSILQAYNKGGKAAAEKLISTLYGKRMMDSIYSQTQRIETSRHNVLAKLTAANSKSGENAQQFNIILIIIVLLSGAALFWYIINIIQKLMRSEKSVKEAAQVKQNFLANMSHEIRTPMNAILGFTKLLQKEPLTDLSTEYVQTIERSGENLLAIINDILDLNKIEAGMMRIESAPFNIRDVIHSVEALFREKAKEKQICLTTAIDEKVPEMLEGDATRLTQILINLVGNAIKFTRKGDVAVKIFCTNKTAGSVDTRIQVSDTGIGIEQEKINDMFERFKQADDAVTRKFGGTGLGLSIVKELVTLQKGSIKATSQPGVGTTIDVTIPYKIAGKNMAAANMSLPDTNNQVPLHDCILVVEDNEINQSLVRHLFNSWGLPFDIAANGRVAADLLKQHPEKYSLVLMDIQMPESDGYSAAQEIRHTLQLGIPIIAMTAHALEGEKEKCLAHGMDAYISKPIRQEELYQLIARFSKNNPGSYKARAIPPAEKINTPYKHINLHYMKEISGGNIDYEKTVTEQFIQSVPQDLAAIYSSWRQQDVDNMRQLAHNMKTTVSIMGLDKILQPALDSLEYEDMTADLFKDRFNMLSGICQAAVQEAAQFYLTLPNQ